LGPGNDCAGDSAQQKISFNQEKRKAGNEDTGEKGLETRSTPTLLGATHRAFTFYLGNPISSILNILFVLSKALAPCVPAAQ